MGPSFWCAGDLDPGLGNRVPWELRGHGCASWRPCEAHCSQITLAGWEDRTCWRALQGDLREGTRLDPNKFVGGAENALARGGGGEEPLWEPKWILTDAATTRPLSTPTWFFAVGRLP